MFLRCLVIVLGVFALLVGPGRVAAQDRPPDTTRVDTARVDTARVDTARPDPSRPLPADTLRRGPSGGPDRPTRGRPDTSQSQPEENAIRLSGRDSLVVVQDSSGTHGTLRGEADMRYRGARLRSRTIEMDFESGTLEATGPPSDTVQNGRPIFERGEGGANAQSFTGEVLSYNVNTERGRVETARTEQREGFVEGGVVKAFEDSTLFVSRGNYTTCNCPPGEEPSYTLRSDEMKVQDEWVYTGPIQLFLFNVPSPLWLPFGFLPNTSVDERRSGPLAPDYGEDRRGFFVKNWGWYFALNEFTDLAVRGGIWTQGTFEVRPRFRYRKRNVYNGDVRVTLLRERIGEEEDPDFQNQLEGEFRWSHDQTLSPSANLNANVNLVTTSDFSQRNSETFEGAVGQDIRSSVNYEKQWANGQRQLDLDGRQQQRFQTGTSDEVTLSFPNASFSQGEFNPFRRDRAVGEDAWYEKIRTSYSLDVSNTYNFTPRNPARLRERGDTTLANRIEQADIGWFEAMFDREKFELATGEDDPFDFQAVHDIPLRATFRLDRYNLSISPNVNYSSDWRLSTLRVVADSSGPREQNEFETAEETVPDFHARHDLSTSLSANAEAFGTFPLRVGPFEGLRHRLNPSLSANYRPNFNAPFWGRTRVLRDSTGDPVLDPETGEPRRFDILSGSLVRSSTEQRSINFNLRNTFETKRVRVDSAGERSTDRITVLNLDLRNINYNLAADSFKVGDNIQLDARTTVERFDINLRTTYSPYVLRRRGGEFRREDQLMITESPWTPVRLTDFNLNISGNFSGGNGGSGAIGGAAGATGGGRRGPRAQSSRQQTGRRRDSAYPEQGLLPFDLPWSLNFEFNYRFRRPQKEVESRTATIGTDFSLGLTPRWQIRGRSGYDFIENEISTTRISMSRTVGSCGCWIMSFNWVPLGRFQSWGFNLQVSSGQLSRLLRLQLPRDSGQGRLSEFGDQLQGTITDPIGGGRFP